MAGKKVKIKNLTGLHLRPANVLCDTAVQYRSKVTFQKENTISNAKSLLSVLGAKVKFGDELEFICEGEDETEALEAIIQAVESGLGD